MARNGTLAKIQELKPSFQATTEQITIGIDLGDRFSHCCVLGPDGRILTEGRLAFYAGNSGTAFSRSSTVAYCHRSGDSLAVVEPIADEVGPRGDRRQST